jgi:hypothetical protein
MTKDQLIEAAKELDFAQRRELVDDLLIMDDSGAREETSREWAVEIERRIGEIDRGEVVLIPAEVVFEKIRAKYVK